ncbi:MAG: cell division protein FtsX [Firmicutes bacterium HGW-Firmicutes-16]|nr:MAG: cell division protein FtsX [Firmicutes bacterium HGW-Firmicutes-16]
MRKSAFYPKLAVQNIRRNKQFYLPFILTCIATTAMFYIMCFLAYNPATEGLHEALYFIMQLGCIVVGFFSAIFLFYTNSFLMKRRQKELGLYNILGMGKGNIAGVLFFETLYVTLITLVCGIALGILLSKLTLLVLCKLIAFSVPYGFEISIKGILYSVYLFCGIFLVILISNLVRIKLSKPIELLRGGNVGEKEPKTKWILAILGVLALGAGYWIAIVTDAPLQAILLFFVAVLLVIIGTYLLFTASSIAILKRLRSRPNYYYTTRHFIPVSGMIYRMKQNAVGLANICILATMVLVMVSGTVCLYLGTADSLKNSFPTELIVTVSAPTGSARDDFRSAIDKSVTDSGLEMSNITDFYSLSFSTKLENADFGDTLHAYTNQTDNSNVYLLPASEYGRMLGETITLSPNEAFIYADNSQLDGSFSLLGTDYKITRELVSFPAISKQATLIPYRFIIVVADDSFTEICGAQTLVAPDWYYGFDLSGTSAQKIACCDAMESAMGNTAISSGSYDYTHIASIDAGKTDVYAMNGGFLFLGLFLGLIFLIATVLIIYYKQLSEGYDDKERFEIMQKVGLSRPEIKKAIRSQVLVVFFLPLGMAVVHIAFAFKMITKLLLIFNLTNVTLFAVCTLATVAVFALIYGVVYMLTAKIYYKIVS